MSDEIKTGDRVQSDSGQGSIVEREVWAVRGTRAWASSPYHDDGVIVRFGDLTKVKPEFVTGKTYRHREQGWVFTVAGVRYGKAVGWKKYRDGDSGDNFFPSAYNADEADEWTEVADG